MNAGSAAPSPDGLPLPGGPPPQSAPQLDEALDARWFGGDAAAASSRGNAEQQTSGMPERARGNGFLSWLFSWGGDGSSSSSGGGSKRGRRPAAARAGTQRPRPGAEGAVPAPLPRPKSAAKLQPGPGGSSTYVVTPSNGAAAGTGPAPPQQPQQQPQQQQHPNPQQPADNKRRSTRSAAVQASYAARRQAWRQRIDAIKNSRRDAGGPDPTAAPAAGTGPGSHRVFSKHVAIPVGLGGVGGSRVGSTAGSQHGTPFGSPKRHEPLLDAAGAALPPLEVPPIWLGYQTAEALADLAAASGDQLRRFLQQAGWPAEAAAALPDQDALVAAVRSARGAWEVERVIVACTWPEEVLRVPRKCVDAALLKAAYRRVSMAVHPDKCSAEGASDAMSIVADCYATLLAAANDGRAAKAVPAFMRAAHSSRSLHASGSAANLAGAATVSAPAAGQQAQQAQQQAQQTAQPERRQTAEGQPQGRASPGLPPHPPAWHSRHPSAESFFTEGAAAAPWPDYPGQQAGQGEEPQPQQRNSSSLSEGGASPLLQRTGSTASSSQDWNPHGQLSSEEREAAAAAAWEQATGGWPVAAMRSRSSSAASVAAADEASPLAQQPASRRGSSSSLASTAGPGGSQHGPPSAAAGAGSAAAGTAAQVGLQQDVSGSSQRSPVQQPVGLGSPSPMNSSSPSPANGSAPGSSAPAGDSPGTPAGRSSERSSPLPPQPPAAPGQHASGGRTSPLPPPQVTANGVPPAPPRPASAGAGAWPRPSGVAGSGGPPQKQKVRITLKVVRKDKDTA